MPFPLMLSAVLAELTRSADAPRNWLHSGAGIETRLHGRFRRDCVLPKKECRNRSRVSLSALVFRPVTSTFRCKNIKVKLVAGAAFAQGPRDYFRAASRVRVGERYRALTGNDNERLLSIHWLRLLPAVMFGIVKIRRFSLPQADGKRRLERCRLHGENR
jgi:hypothetical protein